MVFEVKKYIDNSWMAIVNDENLREDPIQFIQKLLDLYIDLDKILKNWFDSHYSIKRAREDAFQKIMNEFIPTTKYLAYYCDD